METKEIEELIRQKFAWSGGHEIVLITRDGASLCCGCARREYRQIAHDRIHKCDTGWRIDGYYLTCDMEEPKTCDCCSNWIIPSHMDEDAFARWMATD